MEEILIDTLKTYGVLGLWTMWLLYERQKHNKQLASLIDNNTKALTRVYEVLQKCQKK